MERYDPDLWTDEFAFLSRNAELHVVDGGHFALDTAADQIAQLVRDFMK